MLSIENDGKRKKYDVKYRATIIKSKLSKVEHITNEQEAYINKDYTILLYPKTSTANYILKKYTKYNTLDEDRFRTSGRWNLREAIEYGLESELYSGDKSIWGEPYNDIYSLIYLNEFCMLAESLDDKIIDICDGDDVPLYLESESFRMVISHKYSGEV